MASEDTSRTEGDSPEPFGPDDDWWELESRWFLRAKVSAYLQACLDGVRKHEELSMAISESGRCEGLSEDSLSARIGVLRHEREALRYAKLAEWIVKTTKGRL